MEFKSYLVESLCRHSVTINTLSEHTRELEQTIQKLEEEAEYSKKTIEALLLRVGDI